MCHPSCPVLLSIAVTFLSPLAAQPPPFDRAGLDAAVAAELPGTRALIVARDDEILYERYDPSGGPESPMPVLPNMLVSTIYGAGHSAGLLPSVDTKIEAALNRVRGSDPRFHAETIRNFLTMTAGLASYNFPFWEDDPLQMIYRRKMLLAPGDAWNLEYEDAQVVLHLVGKLSGRTVQDTASELLFGPLEISSYIWGNDPLGSYDTLTPVSLKPRDYLKFGQLHLAKGSWGGKRILDESWVAEATRSQIEVPFAKRGISSVVGMGYYWWIVDGPGLRGYAAISEGGQVADTPQSILLVVPERRVVVLLWNLEAERSGATFDDWFAFLRRNVIDRLGPETAS